MKTNKDFDFGKWLQERAAKAPTKTVNFSDLTKIEKVETLLALLGQTETDMIDVKLLSSESQMFGECSAMAKNAILMAECNSAIAENRAPNLPKDTDIVNVPTRTSFGAATLNAKINFLSALYGKPLETVTVNLPCGSDWVNGLKAYIVDEYLKEKEAKEAK